jgi:GT2 family glycosyltransferase
VLEAIVVDNGEDEQTIREAEAMPSVEVVRPGMNLGFAGGCNAGAERATGDVLVFMNQDTIATPAAVRELAATLDDRTIGIATARLRLLDREDRLNSYGTVLHISGLAWAGGYGEPANVLSEPREAPFPSGAAMAVRRELFRELGEFTDDLFMYLEDVELGWRARLRGLRVIATPRADVFHDYDFARNPGKQYLLERNRLVFVLSAYPLRLLFLLSPVLVAAEVGLLALALKEGWAKEKLRGWGWCLRRLGWLAQHRRETQRLRRVPVRDVAKHLTPVVDAKMLTVPRLLSVANPVMSAYWSLVRRAL